MSSAVLEIVELADGSIVLRQSGADEALVSVKFSPVAKSYLNGHHSQVARLMLDMGIQVAGRLVSGEDDPDAVPKVLH